MSWASELILISAKIYCWCGAKVCCIPNQNFPTWSSLILPVVHLQWLTGMHITGASTTGMVTSAVQEENMAHQLFTLFWYGFKVRNSGEEWKGENSNTKKKTEPKNPKLWLIINVKCQSLKLSFFSCAWVHKGEVPSEDDFIFYFWVWRSWMWFGKFIKILWWSWAAIWKYYVQRCKKA